MLAHSLLSLWTRTALTQADTRCHSRCVSHLQALYGVPVDAQALSRAGHPLADCAPLGAAWGETLQLALRMRGACTCRTPIHRGAARLLALRSAASCLGGPPRWCAACGVSRLHLTSLSGAAQCQVA
jgi:hypothetical protein